jgi:hypothetical protein
MPGHYGDKEKTKTKTVTKRKNGKVVTKSKTKTKIKGGKKKAQGNNMEVGRLLKGLASSAKKSDPYDSTKNQTFKGDVKELMGRKTDYKPYTGQ